MEINEKKGCFILFIICIAFILYTFVGLHNAITPLSKVEMVKFDNPQCELFINARAYGFGASHTRFIITKYNFEDEERAIDLENDLVIKEIDSLYYQKRGENELTIIIPTTIAEDSFTQIVYGIIVNVDYIEKECLHLKTKEYNLLTIY